MSWKSEGKVCCVPGCQTTQRKNPGLTFYSFPNRDYEVNRKKLWIARVRRERDKNGSWEPTKNTRICADHFVCGVKSNNPANENFNPTIFPWKPANECSEARRQRVTARNEKKTLNSARDAEGLADSAESPDVLEVADSLPSMLDKKQTCEISVQTDESLFVESDQYETILYCWQNSATNDAGTQTSISIINRARTKIIEVPVMKDVKSRTIAVGPDNEMRNGFQGFADVDNDHVMKRLGGIDLALFFILLEFIKPNAEGQPKYYKVMGSKDRLLLFLMKMKLGIPFTALACIFKISKTTARKIFFEILENLSQATKTWIFWMSREAVKATLPSSFRSYPNCRAIIDCTELHCETPSTVEQRALMYSSYKSNFTVKYLVAIAPCGLITFISRGYGGRATDSYIVNDSRFVELIEPGDEIMADKGFPQIRSELLKHNTVLIMPPFATNPQFSRDEVLEGYKIASVRIHVERCIQRIKLFKVLDYIPVTSLPYVDKLMYMACVLANNKEPLIQEHELSVSE